MSILRFEMIAVGAGAFPVGAGVLDGPVGRFGTSARGVGDAAPYDRGGSVRRHGASRTLPPTTGGRFDTS
ncbi:MAG: hypothetical protein IKS21_06300, partial [Oscillospiraceae bacterium]|nr:hypothetical protein [Oscillospiraceae bacterium]